MSSKTKSTLVVLALTISTFGFYYVIRRRKERSL